MSAGRPAEQKTEEPKPMTTTICAPTPAAPAMTLIEAVYSLAPGAVERARRLEHAARILRSGSTRREAARLLRDRYGCSQPTAWRIVDAAADLTIIESPSGRKG